MNIFLYRVYIQEMILWIQTIFVVRLKIFFRERLHFNIIMSGRLIHASDHNKDLPVQYKVKGILW